MDEQDGSLLDYEREEEEEGECRTDGNLCLFRLTNKETFNFPAWKDDWADLVQTLGLPADTPPPPLPDRSYVPLGSGGNAAAPAGTAEADGDTDHGAPSAAAGDKRKKGATSAASKKKKKEEKPAGAANPLLTVLREEDLKPPEVPGPEEMEKMIVERQKKELLAEYIGT
jgi:pre-mRNA-splicing factor ISY1